MKVFSRLAVIVLGFLLCQSYPALAAPPSGTNEPVNYVIKVSWKEAKGEVNSLQVTTMEGQFELDTIQKQTVKINDSNIPSTLKLSGTLNVLSEKKGKLNLFLGRTVPYVTGSVANNSGRNMSSYSQMSVGLNSNFVITFGKPLVIQVDDSGEVTVLVTREE